MAIDYGISSLDTGASDITYSGDEGPKSPDQQLMASADPMLVEEYKKYVFEMEEQGQTPISFKQFIQQIMSESRMAEGGIARLGYRGGKTIKGQDHMLAYITPGEANTLKNLGGQETMTSEGIPAYPPGDNYSGPTYSSPPDTSHDRGGQQHQALAAPKPSGVSVHGGKQVEDINFGLLEEIRRQKEEKIDTPPEEENWFKKQLDDRSKMAYNAAKFTQGKWTYDKRRRFFNQLSDAQKKELGYGKHFESDWDDLEEWEKNMLMDYDVYSDFNDLGYRDWLDKDYVKKFGPKETGEGQARELNQLYSNYIPGQGGGGGGTTPDPDPVIPTDPVTTGPLTNEYNIQGGSNIYANLPSALPTGQTTGWTFDPTTEMLKRYMADGGRAGYAGGGIADLRQAYGLGKFVKKIGKTIKKVAKSPLGKAALMYGLGSIPFGASNASLLSRMGGMFTGGGNGMLSKALGSMQDKPFPWILGASALGGLYTKMTEDDEEEDDKYKKWLADKARWNTQFAGISDPSNLQPIRFADGGRIGYGSGTAYPDPNRVVPEGNLKDNLLNIFRNKFAGREQTMPLRGGQIRQDGRGMGNLIPQSFQILEYENYRANGGDLEFNEWKSRQQAAQGGRIGYKKGGDHTDRQRALNMLSGIRSNAQEGGLMDLGGMEKDYRNDGGFVPIGGQERADDVPARLSKNEFVFTADAVRAAGGGDIDKGAEIMENVMENLEEGGNISEESQGLEGARDMFATSQRLEGVL